MASTAISRSFGLARDKATVNRAYPALARLTVTELTVTLGGASFGTPAHAASNAAATTNSATGRRRLIQTLKRKCMTSPSFTT